MEKMPFQTDGAGAPPTNWRGGLPTLVGSNFILRELTAADAASLLAMISTEEVSRFISPPPATIDGYERFIAWAIHQREQGRQACYGVVPNGHDTAIGLFQLRSLESGFGACEWGFALGSQYWGTGLFPEGARLVLSFGVDVIKLKRFEARAAVANGRGNGALRKIGAVQEAILRRSFFRNGEYHDQVLWSILGEDWRMQRATAEAPVH